MVQTPSVDIFDEKSINNHKKHYKIFQIMNGFI